MLARRDVDERPPATVIAGLGTRSTKAIASRRSDRAIEVELHPGLGAGRDLVAFEGDQPAADFGGSVVQQELGSMTHRLWSGGKARSLASMRRVGSIAWGRASTSPA